MERNINLSEEKKCEVCGEYKPIREFSKSYPHRCKSCVAEGARLSRKGQKMQSADKNKIDWEARRFELVKISLKGYLPHIDRFTTELKIANTCIAIADQIIDKMKGNEE